MSRRSCYNPNSELVSEGRASTTSSELQLKQHVLASSPQTSQMEEGVSKSTGSEGVFGELRLKRDKRLRRPLLLKSNRLSMIELICWDGDNSGFGPIFISTPNEP